jgi:hypothetical protein
MSSRRRYNPKRRILPLAQQPAEQRIDLAARISYGGNPEHKMYPNDYGLTPPASPRPGKALCDGDGPFSKAAAETLLRSGASKGMVSMQRRNGWPQNIWAISATGVAFEAQLENAEQGVYHGYPMALDDVFRQIVLKEWNRR